MWIKREGSKNQGHDHQIEIANDFEQILQISTKRKCMDTSDEIFDTGV